MEMSKHTVEGGERQKRKQKKRKESWGVVKDEDGRMDAFVAEADFFGNWEEREKTRKK